AGLDHLGDDPLVLLADGFAGVEQHHGDLGGLDGSGGAQGCVVFRAGRLVDSFAQPGRDQRLTASSSRFWLSALLATRMTGLWLRRSIFTAASSTSVAPTETSTTKMTTSA